MLRFFLYILLIFSLASCSEQGDGSLTIRLIDSPGDFEKVVIDITTVEANLDGSWITLDATTGQVDLLELTGGAELVLADEQMPVGNLGQVRLILGENNFLVMDGTEFPLKTPSAQQSGLKINVNTTIEENTNHDILLDFDVARSVVSAGAKKFLLKPVIRVINNSDKGSVSGRVLPGEEIVGVYAKTDNFALATTYAGQNSADWKLAGLAPGIYTIEFDPGESSIYLPLLIENVEIISGENVDLGEVTLELK